MPSGTVYRPWDTLRGRTSSSNIDRPTATPVSTGYDNAVLADAPVGYWPLAPGVTTDLSGHGLHGTFTGNPSFATLPNGDPAPRFNGLDQYFTIPDNNLLEIVRTGRSSLLDDLRRRLPPGVAELSAVLSLPKIKTLHEALGIASVAELEAACRAGRVPPAWRR